ncbi:MAG: hypothetical protein K8I02_07185, partial [Candidatus Methylomirabilis sp.]|nr:hypothetical protein [Deltaproteobacteria bacterium]
MDGGSATAPLGPRPAGGGPTVVFDVFAQPFPEIPLPNDIATRVDFASPTGLRLNASMIGPTQLERDLRRNLDLLDGWGTFAPIFVRFDEPLDVPEIMRRHQENLSFADDAVYLIDIDPASPKFGEAEILDMGRGNFPIGLDPAKRSQYFQIDPRREANNLLYEVVAEDVNGNGVMDPGEDTDQDGVLDRPNILNPKTGRQCTAEEMDLPECAPYDHIVDFYEYETNTLTIRPLVPLRERGRYAVVLSNRLVGEDGESVRSPFPGVNHVRQNEALSALPGILASHPEYGIGMEDVAFAWSFSTQSVTEELRLLVDGVHGRGPFSWIPDEVPPVISEISDFGVPEIGLGNSRIIKISEIQDLLGLAGFILFIGFELTDLADIPAQVEALLASYESIDYIVAGAYETPYFIANEDAVFRTDARTGAAEYGVNRATWWMTVPKTIPGECEPPFPVAIYQHGYSSSKLEMLGFAGSLGRFCIATIGLDAVEHGPDTNFSDIPGTLERVFDGQPLEIGLRNLILEALGPDPDPSLVDLIDGLLASLFEFVKSFVAQLVVKFDPRFDDPAEVLARVEDLKDAVLLMTDTPVFKKAFADGRAIDVTGDGAVDSGARFWTGNLFRTRDQVRQTVVDLAFLVRIFQGFDGAARWDFDIGGSNVAGDFNGDGQVDAGGPDAKFYILGQSMGGFFTAILPAVEPAIRASSPSVSGAGLADVGVRTTQEGAVEAIFLEIMGPLIVGGSGEAIDRNPLAPFRLDPETRYIGFDVAGGNIETFRPLIEGADVEEGDVATLRNFVNGREATTRLGPTGAFRLAVDAQKDDPLSLEIRGPGGELKEALTVPAPASGFGERRNTPDFRRLLGIAQLVLEPADPGNYAPYLWETPFDGRAPSP